MFPFWYTGWLNVLNKLLAFTYMKQNTTKTGGIQHHEFQLSLLLVRTALFFTYTHLLQIKLAMIYFAPAEQTSLLTHTPEPVTWIVKVHILHDQQIG